MAFIGLNLVILLVIFSMLYTLQLWQHRSLSLKILNVTVVFLMASLAYFSLESYQGWPSSQRIPHAQLLAVEINDSVDQNAAAIYIWVRQLPEDNTLLDSLISYRYPDAGAPRSYRIAYTEESAQKFSDAQQKLKQGFIVEINGANDTADTAEAQTQGLAGGSLKDKIDMPNIRILNPQDLLRKSK